MVTWARYRHRVSGVEVTIASTHLDQLCATSRSASAQQLVELVESLGDGPLVLAGDFNDEPGSPAYRTLTGALTAVFPTTEPQQTFNGYGAGGGCIDWMWQRGFDAARSGMCSRPTPPVSDHNGVLAQLVLDEPATAAR
jgi:endonuclease/exonuclease/phosphatase family metal-dependent hydrolase